MRTRRIPITLVILLSLCGRAAIAFDDLRCHGQPAAVDHPAGSALHGHDCHPPTTRHCAAADHACCHGIGLPMYGLYSQGPRERAIYAAFRVPGVRVPIPPVLLRPPIPA